jgi:fructokinase
MRRVFGIGETIYDIIFKDGQPIAGVPGGSVFNGLMTLGKLGVKCTQISEVGSDQVGLIIKETMEKNGVDTGYLSCYEGKKTAISLAFLDQNSNANYSFYKDYPNIRLEFELPQMDSEDIVLFGSYYALNPALRKQVGGFLKHAKESGALLYYDLNFRANHKDEVESLYNTFYENFCLADIVRGSDEDFNILYGETDIRKIYDRHIKGRCNILIMTHGADGVEIIDRGNYYKIPSKKIENVVSTIGAGDNFNAGIAYSLIAESIYHANLERIDETMWKRVITYGIAFATKACQTTNNYIDIDVNEIFQ